MNKLSEMREYRFREVGRLCNVSINTRVFGSHFRSRDQFGSSAFRRKFVRKILTTSTPLSVTLNFAALEISKSSMRQDEHEVRCPCRQAWPVIVPLINSTVMKIGEFVWSKDVNSVSIPQTDSIQELANFWDTHDVTDFEDQLEEETEQVFERNRR